MAIFWFASSGRRWCPETCPDMRFPSTYMFPASAATTEHRWHWMHDVETHWYLSRVSELWRLGTCGYWWLTLNLFAVDGRSKWTLVVMLELQPEKMRFNEICCRYTAPKIPISYVPVIKSSWSNVQVGCEYSPELFGFHLPSVLSYLNVKKYLKFNSMEVCAKRSHNMLVSIYRSTLLPKHV